MARDSAHQIALNTARVECCDAIPSRNEAKEAKVLAGCAPAPRADISAPVGCGARAISEPWNRR